MGILFMEINMDIDYEKLRSDLIDYYGTALSLGFGMAIIDVIKVESASNLELIEIAKKNGFDLKEYEKKWVFKKF